MSRSLLDIIEDIIESLLSQHDSDILQKLDSIQTELDSIQKSVAELPTLAQIEEILGIPGFPTNMAVKTELPQSGETK